MVNPKPAPYDRPIPDTVIRLWTLSEDEAIKAVESAVAHHRSPLVVHIASKSKRSSNALLKRLMASGAQTCAVPSQHLSDFEILADFACVLAGLQGSSYVPSSVGDASVTSPIDKPQLTPEERQEFLRAFYSGKTDGNLTG